MPSPHPTSRIRSPGFGSSRSSAAPPSSATKRPTRLHPVAIGRFVHQAVELTRIVELQFEEPAFALGVTVHDRRIVSDLAVAVEDFTRNRRIDVRCGLYGFDDGGFLALVQVLAGFGDLREDDVAELLLRMVGDADRRGVAVDPDPFMLLGEVEAHASGSLAMIAVGDERHRDDPSVEQLAALLELQRGAIGGERSGDVAHGDRPLQ